MRNSLVLVLIMSFSLLSCKTADTAKAKTASSDLKTDYYEAVSVKGINLEKQKISIYLNTEEKAISGNATCNDYRFSYEIKDSQVKMIRGISTKMYCEGKMEEERNFMSQLGKVKYLSQTKGKLYLKDGDNKLLIKAKKTKRS